ncbi:hypothetical protein [Nonomuraea rubra]|uniref:hypothetical protein n=1 Tax=Nonomuraea rubra TaxID=46180 RepID=UPI0031F14832
MNRRRLSVVGGPAALSLDAMASIAYGVAALTSAFPGLLPSLDRRGGWSGASRPSRSSSRYEPADGRRARARLATDAPEPARGRSARALRRRTDAVVCRMRFRVSDRPVPVEPSAAAG